ncbi:hypothetical protein CDD81_688 [Ophiocordyceps australis]|uniref:Acyl-protein thioesterase 1 n=1 Tax=Ophiocordyceps australis TaxID=1399860 RepID=A0A2C5XXM2_9HYPO|nr:hypothetical protein CDD81_688 [Ophiocordyceps australis]
MAQSRDYYPEPVVVEAQGEHTATIFVMHGVGQTTDDMMAAVEAWRQCRELQSIKWILPQSPTIALTADFGKPTTAWYDVTDVEVDETRSSTDMTRILASQRHVQSLIEAEQAQGIPAQRVMLVGFSQGGAIAAGVATTMRDRVGGVVIMSSRMTTIKIACQTLPDSIRHKDICFFIAHGIDDRVVPVTEAKACFDSMMEWEGANVSWHVYPDLGHEMGADELEDACEFIRERLDL